MKKIILFFVFATVLPNLFAGDKIIIEKQIESDGYVWYKKTIMDEASQSRKSMSICDASGNTIHEGWNVLYDSEMHLLHVTHRDRIQDYYNRAGECIFPHSARVYGLRSYHRERIDGVMYSWCTVVKLGSDGSKLAGIYCFTTDEWILPANYRSAHLHYNKTYNKFLICIWDKDKGPGDSYYKDILGNNYGHVDYRNDYLWVKSKDSWKKFKPVSDLPSGIPFKSVKIKNHNFPGMHFHITSASLYGGDPFPYEADICFGSFGENFKLVKVEGDGEGNIDGPLEIITLKEEDDFNSSPLVWYVDVDNTNIHYAFSSLDGECAMIKRKYTQNGKYFDEYYYFDCVGSNEPWLK